MNLTRKLLLLLLPCILLPWHLSAAEIADSLLIEEMRFEADADSVWIESMQIEMLADSVAMESFDAESYWAQMPADSLRYRTASVRGDCNRTEKFHVTQLIAPVALIGIGSFGVKNGWFRKIDNEVKNGLANLRNDNYLRIDDWIQYLPAAGYLTLGFIPGVKHKHNFTERLIAGTTAYAMMALVVNSVKYTVCEMRPDDTTKNSFPSGHTATVFTGAELIRLEYGPWIGLGAYAVGAAVSFLRMYNERHWLNDVLAGAGIGILCADAAYWLLPLERKWFKIPSNMDLCVMPYYSPTNISGGLALTMQW